MRDAAPQSKISRTWRNAVSLARGKRDYVADLAADSQSGLARLTQRRKWLIAAAVLGLIGTAVGWLVALRFPYFISNIYSYGVNSNLPSRYSTLLTVLLMSIPFAPPFIVVFALSHLLFPLPTEPLIEPGVMSSFEYGQQSSKQALVLIVAGMAGALNCLLLIIAVTNATGH
jgi:hypothetical protein